MHGYVAQILASNMKKLDNCTHWIDLCKTLKQEY